MGYVFLIVARKISELSAVAPSITSIRGKAQMICTEAMTTTTDANGSQRNHLSGLSLPGLQKDADSGFRSAVEVSAFNEPVIHFVAFSARRTSNIRLNFL